MFKKANRDFSRFLEIAIGSDHEVETHLLISSDLNFIKEDDANVLIAKLDRIVKMTSKFRSTLK